MSFYALEFIYNNKSSEQFNVFIANNGNEFTVSSQEPKTDKSSNGIYNHIIDIQDDAPLEFEIMIANKDRKLDRHEINRLFNWLQPNDNEYHKLYIMQDDMRGYYYNCRFTEINSITLGNLPYACICKVVCDSQYLWSNEQVQNTNIITTPTTVVFNNTSSTPLLYPIYEFKCSLPEGNIEIKNITTNELVKFKQLKLNEVITIDTENEIMSSDLGLKVFNRLDNCPPKFITLSNGKHTFTITGNVSNFKIKYKNARKFGG